jgi:hypothetical protein
MLNARSTSIDTSASPSWSRVESFTPRYRTKKRMTAQMTFQPQTGSGSLLNSVKIVSWTKPPMNTPRPIVSAIAPP